MSVLYKIGQINALNGPFTPISSDLFGVNTLISYADLADPVDQLSISLAHMNPGRFRYPGGAITETYADQIFEHVLSETSDIEAWPGLETTPLLLSDILARASENDAALTIVIPTQNAFSTSAKTALDIGTYGQRDLLSWNGNSAQGLLTQLSLFAQNTSDTHDKGETTVFAPWNGDYLRMARHYVSSVMQHADAANVRIAAFEIGNEFWGSGQMTASEYAKLVSQLANTLAVDFESGVFAGYSAQQDAPALLAQSLAAAGSFSPNGTRDIQIGGDLYTIPDQGTAREQNQTIVNALNAANAGDALDGVITHYYDNNGLQDVDNTSFIFRQLEYWSENLIRTEATLDLSFQVTEWDVGTSDANNGGLQQAQMLVEQFYNMALAGVDGADIWPLHFYKTQGTSLTDDKTQNLAMGGEIFRMMSENLIGLVPVLDWEISGEIDVHGYGNDTELVLLISERTGFDRPDVVLDLSELGAGAIRVKQAHLLSNDLPDTSDPDSAEFANGLPVITEYSAQDLSFHESSDHLTVDLEDWSILQVVFTLEPDEFQF